MAIETTTGSISDNESVNGRSGLDGGLHRSDFSKIRTSVRIPNLIEIQRESYDRFLQMDLLPPERQHRPAGGLPLNVSDL